ncbi:MAG: pyridoxal-phosphate dependent enzyme [Acidobacteria bacterium]|nr:pyridoxal-phosphate dependent enzyme [Acidobacteriota bacterium]
MLFRPDLPTIRHAAELLAPFLPVTRTVSAPSLARDGSPVYLKLEIELPTGSFKPRGAIYALATNLKRRKITEVTASSTGNHGAAVAYAAKVLGVPATIFLPANPNPVKRGKIRDISAKIVETGAGDLAQAFQDAAEYSRRPGVYFLNDATDPDLPAGPATIGFEIAQQVPQAATIYVPMGDTALIRGLAAAAKQLISEVRIVGVQAERAPSYYLSWKQGIVVPTDTCDTCADGLATRTPEAENVAMIRELVDDVVLVSEEQMLGAIRYLYEEEKIIAEPAGAAATAAFLASPVRSGSTVLLVSGANISQDVRQRAGIA